MSEILCYSTQNGIEPFFSALNIDFRPEHLSLETVHLAKNYRIVIGFVCDDFSKPVLKALKKMGIEHIALRSTGYDHVDLKAANTLGLSVSCVGAYSPEAIAEHALCLTLMLARRLKHSQMQQSTGDFTLNHLLGFNLQGKTVGVIGTGAIGSAFIRLLSGFDCDILAHDPKPNPKINVNYTTLETIFEKSDVVSLHCPLHADNHHMINAERLAMMKPNAILINTARGGLVDSAALLSALENKQLDGAGLDVYENERGIFFEQHTTLKDPILKALCALPNVIITPHQAFYTQEALHNIAEMCIKNIQAFLSGNPVNLLSSN